MPSSHWESRILQGSIMTATLGSPEHTFIDRITLAAMEDTGWYRVNYQLGQALPWGQGRGDMFGLTTMCHNDTFGYFCTGSGLGCHYLHREKGRCETDVFLDGCRIYKPLLNQSECWKVGNTTTGNLSATGEIYGDSSRCFFANLSREAPSAEVIPPVGRCYLHRCLGQDVFEVKVQGSDWLPCSAGASIQVPGYHGQLSCPRGRLCQTGTGEGEERTTENTLLGSPSPGSRPLEPTDSPRPWVRVTVWLAVSGSAGCSRMEDDGEAEEGIGSLVKSTNIPRCQVRDPRLCSPSEVCFELVEYSGCCRFTVPFLLGLLTHSLRQGKLHLLTTQGNCTAISIR
ncbi:ciliated left-right organizer metallopeptidase [Hemiscyllium ocellatum]|uniref:ciliated left-right organizer metallopeptidase n=1 Tax=Hemiscyllium ocellatum TaxID=170820 RepID=UPI0029662F94|nr:ciliated left-right organizer metallopeptidase [Hemiscyllium ocellatum]